MSFFTKKLCGKQKGWTVLLRTDYFRLWVDEELGGGGTKKERKVFIHQMKNLIIFKINVKISYCYLKENFINRMSNDFSSFLSFKIKRNRNEK